MLTIGSPFKVFWQSVRDLFDELFLMIGANLVWLLLNLPLIGLAWLLFSGGATALAAVALLLATLVFGPTTAGLLTIAERVTDGRTAKVGVLFEGIRNYWQVSWRIYLPWTLGLLLLLVNIGFYLNQTGSLFTFLAVLCMYMLAIWFGLLIYIGPLMIIQEDKRLLVVARNAMLMTFGRPVFTLLTMVLMLVISVLSLVLPLLLVLLTGSLLSLWGFRATTRLIQDAEARRVRREEQEAAGNPANRDKGRGGQIRPRD